MSKFIPAFVAVVLLGAASVQACESVQLVAAPVYAQQIVAAPIVYQAQVQAVQVQQVAYAAPVVQQVVVRQRVVNRHRQPLRRAAQIVAPPYGHCR